MKTNYAWTFVNFKSFSFLALYNKNYFEYTNVIIGNETMALLD